MRLTSIAAGILTFAIAGYPALDSIASRAVAATEKSPQGAARGPMGPPGSPPRNDQTEAAPQTQQQTPESQTPLEVKTALVNVFVTARGKHNEIVGDLTKDNFKVYEDGV